MRSAPIPAGRTQCEWPAFRRVAGKIIRDRRGAALREQCGHLALPAATFCGLHHDPAYRERREREEAERQAREQVRRRDRWTMKRLARLPEDRQLDLFVWADAYDAATSEAWRREIDALMDQPRLELPGIDDRRGWDRYLAESERRRQADAARSARIEASARASADAAAIDHGMPSWSMMRLLIYERDQATCFVCGTPVAWEHYHLGHLQDRVCGGSDHPNNLVVMCNVCNLYHKPLHDRREDAIEWARMTREYHERRRANLALHLGRADEILQGWDDLSDEARTELVRSVVAWGDDIEDARQELQQAESQRADD